jgi:hypothetical protein
MPNPIALVDEGGHTIAHKPRATLAATDIYHSVFVLLLTPHKQIVLSYVPSDNPAVDRFSATTTGIRYADETADQTAHRALGATGTRLHHLGDQFFMLQPDRKTYASVYYFIGDLPHPHSNGWAALDRTLLQDRLKEGTAALTPAMQAVWNHYAHLLPL